MSDRMDGGRVALVYPLPSRAVEDDLRKHVTVISPTGDDAASLRDALADADAVILRGPAQLTGELIAGAPRLRAIGAQGSGTDNIDVAAATARGIPVINGAGIAPVPVAEYVIGAMVLGHRRMLAMHQTMAGGRLVWEERLGSYCGTQVTGSTLGIVGFGHIGREVARMASAAFGVHVLAYDPFLPDEVDLGAVERVGDLGALLDRCDTVTLHVPLSEQTRGLIGRSELMRLGENGVLVDAARGGVVDESALADCLREGRIKAAVIDVFDQEPPTAAQLDVLAEVPGLFMTPHVAGITEQGLEALSRNVVDGVMTLLRGGRPAQVVNPEVFSR